MSVEQLRSLIESSDHEHFYVADETAHTTDEQLLLLVYLTAPPIYRTHALDQS